MRLFQGTSMDMTRGSPMRLILGFALPLFLGSVFQMLYNMADAAIVGHFLGPQALAAVGAASPAYNLFTMVISGFAGGASIVVAQASGSGNEESMRRAYSTSLVLLMLSGAAVTFVGLGAAAALLRVLETPEDVFALCLTYLRWMCVGVLAACLYNGMASVLRSVGDSVTPLAALVVSSLLNILLDLLFVIALGMGVGGAAIATVLSQLVSGLYCAFQIYRRIPVFRLRLREYRIYPAVLRETVRLGLPAALSTAVVTASVMLIQRAVNGYGSTVMAAYTAANRAENVCLCLSYSIGMATGVFVAQNAGAMQLDRMRRGLGAGLQVSLLYHAVMATVMWLSAPWLVRAFTESAEVVSVGTEIVRITALFAPVLGVLFVFQSFLRNVSDVFPTVLMSGAEILCRGLLPFLLSARFGYRGIWWATPAGWSLSLLIGIARYASGRWRKVLVSHLHTLNPDGLPSPGERQHIQ